MQNLYKIFIIIPFLLCLSIFSQEPVVFHFNFSFERNYVDLYKWTSNEDVKSITIEVYNSKKYLNWIRSFTFNDIPKDKNGFCLISDTIKTLKRSHDHYSLKVNYKLTSGIDDSCELFFSYPDSVNRLALELYFDQAIIKNIYSDSVHNFTWEEYSINKNPKPVLIVKYLGLEQEVYMDATWFNYYRITNRPEYILYNNSQNYIYRASNEPFTCFFGELYLLDSSFNLKLYKFGSPCLSYVCNDTISPGESVSIVEGYPHSDPKKLVGGYYKYSVLYKDINGDEKTAGTYFSVIYTK